MNVDQLRVLFCADPTNARRPDPLYEVEFAAAQNLGITYDLIDFESLVYDGDASRAVRSVLAANGPTTGVYRGWMLRPGQYATLYAALESRGVQLLNDPEAYALCHHLPNWYPALREWTPASSWLQTDQNVPSEQIASLLRPFRGAPVIVKDFVKSQKHHWHEACFIPSSADRVNAERIVRRFLELQGPDLNEGLVFREFEQFVPLTAHSRSGMPLTREYRLFFLDSEPILTAEYWDEGDYDAQAPPLDQFRSIASLVGSRFFTMDVAMRTDGQWRVVELGDGQVAGLPDRADLPAFYRAVARCLAKSI